MDTLHRIQIFWRGNRVEPETGPDQYSTAPEQIREELRHLFSVTGALVVQLQGQGKFVTGRQDLDLVAELADDPGFQEGFPNSLNDFIASYGDEIVLIAGYNQ